MRVLLCHNNYNVVGGAEVFVHEVSRVLAENGHEVAWLSSYDEQCNSPWRDYFPQCFDYKRVNARSILKFGKMFYSYEAKRAVKRICMDFKPDVVHTFGICTKLTPSILDAFTDMGVPIVASMNDYKHICPNSKLFHHGMICEDCRGGRFYSSIKNRCCHDSVTWSIASAIEAYIHTSANIYKKNITLFLFASIFMARKTEEYWGFNTFNWRLLQNPFNSLCHAVSDSSSDYILFFGRIVEEKGVDVLLKAMSLVPEVKLKIVGDGPLLGGMRLETKAMKLKNVEFLGSVWGKAIDELIKGSRFVVVPSIWYENYPYVIIQSFSYGKPVIGSDRGGISEMIGLNERGLLYSATSFTDLAYSIKSLWDDRSLCADLGKKAKVYADENYNDRTFYEKIISIYSEVKH